MNQLVRILAVLVAMLLYSIVFQLVLLVAVLFMAGESDGASNGEFELAVVALPSWVGSAWLAGLAGVIYLVDFRLPWWRSSAA